MFFLSPTTSQKTISGRTRNCAEVIMTIIQKAPGQLSRRRVQSAWPAGPAATAVLFLVALCSLALADDPIFRVARISLVEGEVSYRRANESEKDWFDATLNLPLEENDQLYSGSDGRAEIQLSGRNVVRISRDTNLRFTQFSPGAIQMALPIGSAYFRIESLDKRQFEVVDANDAGINDPVYFEVDTPTVAVTFVKEGVYRINVDEDGSTEVIVRQGQAEVYGEGIGTIVVNKGKRVEVEGREDHYRLGGFEDKDDWDRWNDGRDNGLFSGAESSDSARYIPVSVPGVYDLDNYGDWIDEPEYGRMWSPMIGRHIATVIGDGFHPTAGRGFRMSLGAGRLITMGDGLTCATAGVGRRSSISARWSPGAGGRITWSSSGGEAVTTAAIATVTTTATGTGSATGATGTWAGARSGRATGITGRGTKRLASKRSGTFALRGL
jgi:FecR protein